MISVFYASLSALLIIILSYHVIQKRRFNRVSVGDGGYDDLQIAIAAQSNAVEYIPIALLLLFALEFNHASHWYVHVCGVLLILSRLIHAKGMLSKHLKTRVLGMQLTFIVLMSLVILNLIYLPYSQFF